MFNASNNTVYCDNGTAWQTMGGGGITFTFLPNTPTGDLLPGQYNSWSELMTALATVSGFMF